MQESIPLTTGSVFHVPWEEGECDVWLVINKDLALRLEQCASTGQSMNIYDPRHFKAEGYVNLHAEERCQSIDYNNNTEDWHWI